uniref:hypothetical protein n=1 Tax=Hafnia paralvei TaxID=546367 RepID=UPI003CF2D5F4
NVVAALLNLSGCWLVVGIFPMSSITGRAKMPKTTSVGRCIQLGVSLDIENYCTLSSNFNL